MSRLQHYGGFTIIGKDVIIQGDCLEKMRELPPESVNLVMFSPPYWGLRDYGMEGQLGLEATYQEFVAKMVEVGEEIKRILRKDGSWYLNLGDTYAGSWGDAYRHDNPSQRPRNVEVWERKGHPKGRPPSSFVTDVPAKCKLLIPHRVAIALIDTGWIVRNDIVWFKPNSMPSSVKDRMTNKFEFIFHLVKSKKYYYDLDAIRVPHTASKGKIEYHNTYSRSAETKIGGRQEGRRKELETKSGVVMAYNPKGKNPGDFWNIATKPFSDAHFAVYPEKLCERPIKSSCPPRGIVLDPFSGSGTTCVMAKRLGRHYIGIELNPEYVEMAKRRLSKVESPLEVFA